jgi:hypothetical protein
MFVDVVIEGHQYYESVQGFALCWGQTVEKFGDSYMQVPSVTLATKVGVQVIPLRMEFRWVNVKRLEVTNDHP